MPASLSGIPLIDPHRLKRDCDRRGVPTDQWWGRASQFVVPLWHRDGIPYGRGQVLIHPGHYAQLPADKTALSLTFIDAAGTAIAFSPVCQIGIERVVSGADDDSASVYLLTLADRRYRFRQVSVGRAYNVRDDLNAWVTASLNAGVAWTWDGIVSSLWGMLTTAFSDFTASAPTFPSAPAGTPEGFYFEGADAWSALVRVVEAGGYLLRFDPTTDTADIVDPAADELAMGDAETRVRLRDTQQHSDATPPWPESLLVTFPRRGRSSRYTVSVAVGEGGAAGTTEVVWDDMPAVGGTVLNATELADRAAAVLAIWKWDFAARFGSADREFAGCVDYVRLAMGTGPWTAWAVSDRGHRDRNGGLVSAMAAGPQRVDRTRADLGAGAGPIRNIPTNVCEILDTYGALTGIRVEYTPVTFPDGTSFGVPFCVDSPDDCCDVTWWCDGGTCVAVASGETPPAGAVGPFGSEGECDAVSSARWYRVDGTCVEVAACEPAPTGGVGPFASEGDCDDIGGGGPCPDAVTYTTATVSLKTGDCTCLPATLTYVANTYPVGDMYAEWTTNTCPGNVSWKLMCNGGVYVLTVGGVPAMPVSYAAGTLVFDSPDLGANCGGSGGTCRVTITV